MSRKGGRSSYRGRSRPLEFVAGSQVSTIDVGRPGPYFHVHSGHIPLKADAWKLPSERCCGIPASLLTLRDAWLRSTHLQDSKKQSLSLGELSMSGGPSSGLLVITIADAFKVASLGDKGQDGKIRKKERGEGSICIDVLQYAID